jgi:polyphenol oxidase
MDRLIFPDLMKDHVTAFFTGKFPGADTAQLGRILNIGADRIYLPIQKHTDKVAIIESSFFSPVIADAVITKEPGIMIGVQVADCVPILLYEKTKGVMAAVHAGWRGTAESILEKTVKTMAERFFCSAEDICIAIGPAIRGCCYQVDFEVFHAVSKATGTGEYFSIQGGKYYLDLPQANKYQALTSGISEENIWISDECTFCSPDKYYSYRFAKGTTGRQGAFIGKL